MKNDRLTEQEALERLNLESFERLSKKDVIRLGSLLPQMQPEVAKKALEQFPEFARAVGGMMSEYKGDLSFEERAYIIDRMVEVSRMLGEKDSENKKFLWGLAGIAAAAVAVAGAIAAGVLGLTTGKDKE